MKNKLFDLEYDFNKEIKVRDCGEVMLAFNPETCDMYEFNYTGEYIFNLLRKEVPIREIYEVVCHDFEVSYDDVDNDIRQIVNRMIDLNCIVIK